MNRLASLALVSKSVFSNRVAPHDSEFKAEDEGLTLGVVPPASCHLRNSIDERILKLCGESEWQPRTIIVTMNNFIITHPGATDVSDQIPLVREINK